MSIEYPPAPAAPKKRMSGWAIAGLIILGLVVLGQFTKSDETTSSTYTPSTSSDTYQEPAGITAEMIVDAMPASTVGEFCGAYDQIGEAGYSTFANSYGSGTPSARLVFDELVSRC